MTPAGCDFPWVTALGSVGTVRTLGQPNAAFADDRGEPDPDLRALMAGAYTDDDAYLRTVAALCTGRFLLPIVADGDDSSGGPNPDRHAEMAAVLLRAADGRTAVVVFSGVDTLMAWNARARPVPCTLDDVAATAVETGSAAVLIDPDGPHPVVLEGELVTQLAQGRRLVGLPGGGYGWLFLGPDAAASD